MGARGPAPKPVELKVLEGNRGHRSLSLDQVFRPEVGLPDIPRWLIPEARKAWKRLTPELLRYNLLSKVDRDALAMLCQAIGRMEQVERAIAAKQAAAVAKKEDPTDALMDVTPNGLRVQSALYQILNKEQGKVHKLLETFGLRPDARAAVSTAIRAQLSLLPEPDGADARSSSSSTKSFADFE